MKKGDIIIDISQHNGYVDFSKLKSKGVEGVILRLGWIGNKNNHTLDTYFESYYEKAKENGIPVGVYVFNYCESKKAIKSGVDWIITNLNGKSFELPIFLDMEDDNRQKYKLSRLGKDKLTDLTIYWNELMISHGYITGTYANLNWFTNYLDISRLVSYKIWCAQYNSSLTLKWKCDLWQYTSSGKLEGVTTSRVDMNKVMCECNPIPTGTPKTEERGAFVNMKVYKNGSTPEIVYSDTSLKNKIGSLDRYESCDCLGIFENRPLVKYRVNGTNTFKCGFVKWLGGVK